MQADGSSPSTSSSSATTGEGGGGRGASAVMMMITRIRRSLYTLSLHRFRKVLVVFLLAGALILLHNGFFSTVTTTTGNLTPVLADDRRLLARDSDIVDKAALARVIPRIPEPENIGDSSFVAAVLVFCATRPNAIRNHLEQLTRLRRNPARFPIVVSQDGDARDVAEAIDPFVKKAGSLFHIQHSKVEPTQKMLKSDKNYFFIAQHYKWALDHVFREMGYSHVIVTEDDLDMAEDFFSYFAAMKPLLEKDPSLWCVSAWNDNGGKDLTDRRDGAKLWRTDFFPGLGWMLRAEVWNELREHWPDRYWDDWMRSPSVRKGRSCVRPEISRTAHNMKLAGKGSSGGLYKSYLSSITLPDSPVDFSLVDTSELMKNNYDTHLAQALADAKAVESVPEEISTEHSYRVKYSNAREWRVLADRFKLMNDIRSGMTRTAYHGVVPFSWKGARIYAVPSWLDEKKLASGEIEEAAYDPRWDLQSKFMDFEKQYCKPTRFTGKCDPANPELREWFKRRNMLKKLDAWGEMVVV